MVSIILPNLNTPLEFLAPRLSSILYQQYSDWECIVIDGFSTNGSWEYIKENTANDDRFTYHQKPARGIYNAWNEGVKLAAGEYIYIATSDDSCDAALLQNMVAALESNADCGFAHCCLEIIDGNGNPTNFQWKDWEKVLFYGNLIDQPHKRIAPYDAVVHFGWDTVYSSIVQLLIRKSFFDSVGEFSTNYGVIADYEWGLRAALKGNLIHVPLYLASWRRHENQASQDDFVNKPKFYADLIVMAKNALADSAISSPTELYFNYLLKQFNKSVKSEKIGTVIQMFTRYPYLTLKVLVYRLFKIHHKVDDFINENLKKRDMQKLIYVVTDQTQLPGAK